MHTHRCTLTRRLASWGWVVVMYDLALLDLVPSGVQVRVVLQTRLHGYSFTPACARTLACCLQHRAAAQACQAHTNQHAPANRT